MGDIISKSKKSEDSEKSEAAAAEPKKLVCVTSLSC